SWRKDLLLLGDPIYAKELQLEEGSGSKLGSGFVLDAFDRIPKTGEEVKTIALTLVTDSEQQVLRKVNSGSRSLDVEGSRFHLLLGAEASKDRLERNLRDYRLIHIAAHGFYDEKAPSFCGLALSQGSGASATGLADQVEIASWNL